MIKPLEKMVLLDVRHLKYMQSSDYYYYEELLFFILCGYGFCLNVIGG